MNKLYVDYNEYSFYPDIGEAFAEFESRNQNVDYIIADCGIEVKHSWNDFYASVIDKRIWRQAKALKKFDKGLFIIIDKKVDARNASEFKRKNSIIDGAFFSLLLNWQIPILICKTEVQFLRKLKKIYEKLNKEKTSSKYVDIKKIGRSDDTRHFGVLAQIEGISVLRAEKIFAEFGSIEKIVNKTAADFAKLEKIGPKLSLRIEEFFKWKYEKISGI